MNLFGYAPIDYFNRWFAEPIRVVGAESVQTIVDALNRHPLAQDETAQDYVMPSGRYLERPGRFRILGESQDIWYCFVYEAEILRDPAVYFETCLDLEIDHGFPHADIIDGDHVMICPEFTSFLWHMLGQLVCIRMEGNGQHAPGVHGIVFQEPVKLDSSFVNPLGREFPAGYTCSFAPDTICVDDWGAAFLDADSARRFHRDFKPIVSRSWA